MSEDRERTVELITSTQVANADLFYKIQQENPVLAKLMLDKLKAFLSNDYFATMERQTILTDFLERHTHNDIIQEVLSSLTECPLKQDYQTIIMEWTYHNSEKIIQRNLAKYDGDLFILPKTPKDPKIVIPEDTGTDAFVQAILQVASELLNNDDGEDGDDENGGAI